MNFLDWRFERQLFPVVLRILNGISVVVYLIAAVLSVLGSLYFFTNDQATYGAALLVGGPLGAALLILLTRLYFEAITVMFEIRRATGDLAMLLTAEGTGTRFGSWVPMPSPPVVAFPVPPAATGHPASFAPPAYPAASPPAYPAASPPPPPPQPPSSQAPSSQAPSSQAPSSQAASSEAVRPPEPASPPQPSSPTTELPPPQPPSAS